MKKHIIKYLFFICFSLAQISVFAQTNPNLENLYRNKRFFELRDELLKKQNTENRKNLFYRGAVANKFNQPKKSIPLLRKYIKQANAEDSDLPDCYELLADDYAKMFQYARAAEIYKSLLEKYGETFEPNKKRDIRDSYKKWSALQNIAPQTVSFKSDTRLQANRDKAGLLNIPIETDGQKMDFIFDTGASISTVTASTAKKLNLKIIETDLSVGTSTDKRVTAKLGIASIIKIGSITVRNVIFLILDDASLFIEPLNYQINGIIGYPVISAFRQITITKKDEVTIPARYVKRQTEQNLYVDDSTPVFAAFYNGGLMSFFLDTGAGSSSLYPAFYKAQENMLKKNAKQREIHIGGAGGVRKYTVYVLDKLPLMIAGKKAVLRDVDVLTEQVGDDNSRNFYGKIGQDLIRQFDKLTLDFRAMSIIFE